MVEPERMAIFKANIFDQVGHIGRDFLTTHLKNISDQVFHPTLVQLNVAELNLGRQNAVEDHPADRGANRIVCSARTCGGHSRHTRWSPAY